MRAHEDRVFGICLRMMSDRDAALDAVQETFLTVFRKADRYEAKAAFSTWLYRVAVNTCYDHCARRSGVAPSPSPRPHDPADRQSGDEFEAVELRPDIEEALLKVPIEFRSAVVLVDSAGPGAGAGLADPRCARRNDQITGIQGKKAAGASTWEPQSRFATSKRRMKMHEHDQELIMALAEGTLEAAAAEAATAEISGVRRMLLQISNCSAWLCPLWTRCPGLPHRYRVGTTLHASLKQ